MVKGCQDEGAQNLRLSLPWPLNIVRWRITFLGWQYGHFISCRSSGSQDFDVAPGFFGKFVNPCFTDSAVVLWSSIPSRCLFLLLLLACCSFQLLDSVCCCDFTLGVAAGKVRRIQNTRGTVRRNSKRKRKNECSNSSYPVGTHSSFSEIFQDNDVKSDDTCIWFDGIKWARLENVHCFTKHLLLGSTFC